MPEADELRAKIATAHDLMHRIVNLQNEVNAQSTRLAARHEAEKSKGPALCIVAGMLIVFDLVTSTPLRFVTFAPVYPLAFVGGAALQATVYNIINIAVSLVGGYFLGKLIRKLLDKRRVSKNLKLEQSNGLAAATNDEIARGIEQTKAAIMQAQQRWAAEVAPWYPADYDTLDAVDFFFAAVRNHRANSMTDLVNLYETEKHHRRMEAGQQQMLSQQRIGNMLQVGSLLVQGSILNQAQSINANTSYVANAMGRPAK